MTRAHFYDDAKDATRPLAGATVDVFQPGTTTPIVETIYAAATGVATLTNPLTANAQGEIEFFLAAPKEVDLRWSKNGYTAESHTSSVMAADLFVLDTEKGTAGGVATLDGTGVVPIAQLPGGAALDAEVSAAVAAEAALRTAADALLETPAGAAAKVAAEATLRVAGDAAEAAARAAAIAGLNGTYVAKKRLVLDLVGDYGAAFNNSTDDTAAWTAALADAKNAVSLGYPATVLMGAGISKVTGLVLPSSITIKGHGEQSQLLLTGSSNANLLQSENYGSASGLDAGIYLRNFKLLGNKANQSATLHPQTYLTADTTVSTSPTTVPVVDTTGFAASGSIWLGTARVTYTGVTGTSFTGATCTSSILVRKAAWVTPTGSKGHLIALQAARCRLENLFGSQGAASGIYFEGPGTAVYGYENVIDRVRMDKCNRFGLEVGEGNPDGQVGKLVVGDSNLMGGALIRSNDWAIDTLHVTGTFGTMPLVPQALLLCANDFRATNVYFDTLPGTAIVIDTGLRGGKAISDLDLGQVRYFNVSRGAGSGGHGVLFRGPGANGIVSRVRFAGHDMFSPVGYGFANGPITRTVGTQNLATLTKLQVISALDFAVSTAVGGTIQVSTDVLSYTGRQMSQALTTADAAIGDTVLNVDDTTGFDSTGSFTLLAVSATGTFTSMTITYTGKTGTTLTGIPASGTGSITTAAPSGAGVAQHFFTGVTGGALTSVGVSSCFSTSQIVSPVSEMQVSDPSFRSFQINRFNMSGSDEFTVIGGVSGGKRMVNKGTISIAAGATTGTATHGLAEAPTTKVVTPTADTQGLRWWATASSTTLTVTVDSPPLTNPVTFDWRVELV